jgi:lysozyme
MKWLPFLIFGLAILGGGVAYTLRKTSFRGLEHLKRLEGFSATPYPDEAGYMTIGYGHRIVPGESFTALSEPQAEELLRADIARAEQAVNQLVQVPLNQAQYDALVSFVFNVGRGAFAESTLLQKLNAYDYQGALSEFPRWNKITRDGVKVASAGLTSRRQAEQELFLS